MPARRTVTGTISPEQDAFRHDCRAAGRYRGVGEMLGSALRLLERDKATAIAAIDNARVHREAIRG